MECKEKLGRNKKQALPIRNHKLYFHVEYISCDGWRKSVGLIVLKIKKYYKEARKKGTS
jgi:hypothetical protein